jgi:hypothetical protein
MVEDILKEVLLFERDGRVKRVRAATGFNFMQPLLRWLEEGSCGALH